MDRTEKVVLGVALLVLVALVVAKYRTPAPSVEAIQPVEAGLGEQNSGPLYLLGNLPWAYTPWAPAVVPQATSGMVGQDFNLTQGASMTKIGASGL